MWCQRVMKRDQWSGPEKRTSPSRHRLCRSQAALHGASGAPRPQMECPQRHHATNHRIKTWRVTELYGVQRRRFRRRCTEDCGCWADRGSSETQNAPTSPMSAPGGFARRFWGTASANGMLATSSRDQSPHKNMASHRTLRPRWRRRL